MKDIYLKKDILSSKNMNNEAIGAYVALRILYQKDEPIAYISVNQMCFMLCGNTNYTRTMKEKIAVGLEALVEASVVKKLEQITCNEMVLDLTGLHIDSSKGTTDFYTVISRNEVSSILNLESRVNKFALLRFFAITIGSINYAATVNDARRSFEDKHNFVGFMPIHYLAETTGIAESVAISYMAILEALGLLYVFRHTEYKWDEYKNQISSFVNKYGRLKDKDAIIAYAETYENYSVFNTVSKMQKKKDANKKRSLTQKYYSMCRGKRYSNKEIEEIYHFIHERNLETKKKINNLRSNPEKLKDNQQYLEFLENKIFDESVFDTKEENK